MAWNGSDLSRHIAFPSAGRFYDNNDYDFNYFNHPFPGSVGAELMKNKSSSRATAEKHRVAGGAVGGEANNNNNNNYEEMRQRKTRLTSDQLDALERSFQEEIKLEQPGEDPKKKKVKLEPERKMWLARELRLHPRQVAIWFQNRRARLKGKQLERLYYALKHEFEIISRQNLNLQQEVMRLKAKLDDRATTLEKQGSTGYMEVSEEAAERVVDVESTSSVANNIGCSSNGCIQGRNSSGQIAGGSYFLSLDDHYSTTTTLPYWVVYPAET